MRLLGVPKAERTVQMIDMAWLQWCNKHGYDVADKSKAVGLYLDIEQNPGRSPWGALKTTLTSTKYYSYGMDRVILSQELLLLFGYTRSTNLASLKQHDIQDLVGEAWALPPLGVCLYAVFLEVEFKDLWSC